MWVALGAVILAALLLGGEHVAATDDLAIGPLPWPLAGALLVGLGAAARRHRIASALAAVVCALWLGDLFHRLDLLAWTPAWDGLAARVARNARLHVRPALLGAVGAAIAVSLALRGIPRTATALRLGSLTAPAPSLGERRPTKWSAVAARFVVAVVVLDAAFLWARGTTWDPGGPYILVPIAVGMFGTALTEEALFRGLLRPVAEDALGPRWGNLLQATVFGVVHVSVPALLSLDPRLAPRELVRVALWTLLAWFLGLAARDTRGIGVPVLLHFVLGLAIYVSLVFRPATGFLG